MYCNRYPSVEGKDFPEGALRIGAHTDFELLTLLFTRPGMTPAKTWSLHKSAQLGTLHNLQPLSTLLPALALPAVPCS